MLCETLLLLRDVKLLDVIDKFLLQTILVVFNIWNECKLLSDALANLLNTKRLILLQLLLNGGKYTKSEIYNSILRYSDSCNKSGQPDKAIALYNKIAKDSD